MSSAVALVAEGGVVRCPVRGPIDVERCVSCEWLVAARATVLGTVITCRSYAHALERNQPQLVFPFAELPP